MEEVRDILGMLCCAASLGAGLFVSPIIPQPGVQRFMSLSHGFVIMFFLLGGCYLVVALLARIARH